MTEQLPSCAQGSSDVGAAALARASAQRRGGRTSICMDCRRANAHPTQGCSKFIRGELPSGSKVRRVGEYLNQVIHCPQFHRDRRVIPGVDE